MAETTTTQVGAYTVTANDFVIFFDPTATFTITLPSAVTAGAGREYRLVQTVSNAGVVTIKATAGKVNTAAAGTGIALTASKIGILTAVSNGTDWFVGGGTATFT